MCDPNLDPREAFPYEPSPADWAEYEAWWAEYEAWLDATDDGEDAPPPDDEPWDGFRDDVDADADVLRMAGWGTDEDYGDYGDYDCDYSFLFDYD